MKLFKGIPPNMLLIKELKSKDLIIGEGDSISSSIPGIDNSLLKGERNMTKEDAVFLSEYTGISKAFWLRLWSNWNS